MRPSLKLEVTSVAHVRVAEGLQNESIYGRLAAYCAVHHTSFEELRMNRNSMERPLFGPWSAALMHSVAQFLEVDTNDLYTMRGRPKCSEYNAIVQVWLRFCPSCMVVGYHPAIFQYRGISRCELHHEDLAESCTKCGKRIIPTLRTTVLWPHRCPSCEALLSPSNVVTANFEQIRRFDRELTVAARTLPDERALEECIPSFELASVSDAVPAAVISRWLRRISTVHSNYRASGLLSEVFVERTASELGCGCTRFLTWLVAQGDCVDDARDLALRLGRDPGDLRLDRPYSAAAVAIYKTLHAYSLVGDFLRFVDGERSLELKSQSKAPHRYSRECWYRKADARVLQLEMLGLLAMLLAQLKPGSHMLDVGWLDLPSPLSWVPAWAHDMFASNTTTITIDTRTNEERVRRLLHRHRYKLIASTS